VIFLQESCTNISFFTLILCGNRFINAIRYGYSRQVLYREKGFLRFALHHDTAQPASRTLLLRNVIYFAFAVVVV